nr:sensor histidine kinase [Thermoflexibacter sp.]
GDYQTFWTKNKESIYVFTLLFFGALGMMFFYNMVLFFTLWDKSYLFYILYLLFYGVRVFVERDFYNDWIAPDPPKYGLLISLLSPLLFTLFQLLFTQSFLEIKHFLAWANQLTKWLIFLIIVNLFLIFLNKFVYFYQLFEFTILLSNVVMLLIAIIVAYKQRKTTTYFYLLGISFLILSTIIYIQVPANEYTIYTFNIALLGALVEMGLFSLGLANKINEVKKALIEQKLAQSHEKAAFIEEKNRELESKVNQRTLELRESNATKDKLFSIISHDLRSPLNTLKGMLAALESDILSRQEIQEIAKDIQKRLDSTDTTLNDLLQWATSQMEGATLKKEVIDIQELIDKKIELFSFIAQNKQVKFYNEVTENISVYADLNHVKVILRNLIANALKFTHVHGNITISARQEIKDFVTIAVKDTGIGMTTAQSQKLFESNTLYTTRGTQNEKGTGLGLLLCKDFVEKNGGKIWVESEYGKGSTFYFTLPSSSPIH